MRRGLAPTLLLGGAVLLVAVVGTVIGLRRPGIPAPDASAPVASSPSAVPPSPAPSASSSPSPSPPSEGGTLVAWARGGLPSAVAEDAATLPGVEAVAFVRSGTLGLVGSRDASGRARDRPGAGRRIPVSVIAVLPEAWSEIVGKPGGSQAGGIGELRPGGVVLSRTGAELRGIGVGGSLDLAGRSDLEVLAVVPDDRLRGAELLLHPEDASTAGIGTSGSLVVRHRRPPGGERDTLASALEELVPAGTTAQVVDGDLAGYRAPLVLTLPEVKRRFGEFAYRPVPGERAIEIEPVFIDANIVRAEVPILGTVTCHHAIIDDLRAALREIVDTGLRSEIDPSAYAGCFNARRISADRDGLSRHSWGIALDINVDLSLPGLGPPPSPGIVAAFGRHGFRWGGDFLHPDNHHFEWVGEGAALRPSS